MESPSTDDQNAKKAAERTTQSPKILRLRNEVALVIVALSLSGAMVVVPRPTYPQILPLPSIDRTQIAPREREEIERAISVRDGSLDKETRAIGEIFRRIGRDLATSRSLRAGELETFRKDVAHLLERPKSDEALSGVEALLDLRALQAQLFLDAVRAWQTDGEPSPDLLELGGPFVAIARDAWVRDGRMVLNDHDLRLLFRIHWGKVTGLSDVTPFEPSLQEMRRYYLANLKHPTGAPGDVMTQTRNQFGLVRGLRKIDATYPADLAEGILHLRLGQPALASKSLRVHLDQHPDGAWAHLARNHLILARRRADEMAKAGP